ARRAGGRRRADRAARQGLRRLVPRLQAQRARTLPAARHRLGVHRVRPSPVTPRSAMTTPEPMPLDEVDLADPGNFTDGVRPWRMFRTLHLEDPVHWQPEPAPNAGFWAVTRHEDIVRVDRDPETFTSTKFVNLEEVDEDQIRRRASILEMDGVRHRALRGLL